MLERKGETTRKRILEEAEQKKQKGKEKRWKLWPSREAAVAAR
jgi:hypothetical protein